MTWKDEITKQPLIDVKKLRTAMLSVSGDMMYDLKHTYGGKYLLLFGSREGDANKEYNITKIQMTDFEVQGKKMTIEGAYTLEELGDFTFTANYIFERPLVAMSILPILKENKFVIKFDDKYAQLTNHNKKEFYNKIRATVYEHISDSFANLEEYGEDFMRTSPLSPRDKNLDGDKRGKQERFKEVLRKAGNTSNRG